MGNMRLRYMTITVSGNTEQIQKLRSAAAGLDDDLKNKVPFSLQALLPTPAELMINDADCHPEIAEKNIAKYGHKNFCGWRREKWGTWTDVDSCKESITGDSDWKIDFDTWDGFPIEAIIQISRAYPVLTFKYVLNIADILDYGIGSVMNGTLNDGGWWPDKEGYFEDGYNYIGFNRDGLNQNGTLFDENGFDANGFDMLGFHINGFSSDGIHRDTGTRYDQDGFDQNEYDANGNHINERSGFRRGFDEFGVHRDTQTPYDRQGYNANGYAADGSHCDDPGF